MKNILKEYDNTATASLTYSNFAVALPGKLSTSVLTHYKDTDQRIYTDDNGREIKIFDDNDIYLCNSQKDFVKYIGITDNSPIPRNPKAPTLSLLGITGEGEAAEEKYEDKYEDNYSYIRGRNVYGHWWTLPNGTRIEGNVYKIIEDPRVETDGYLQKYDGGKKKGYKYVEVTDWTELLEDEDHPDICFIKYGDEGFNGKIATQIGNQIAYELLGLGYTIYYKKFTDLTKLDKEEFWAPFKDKKEYDFRYILTGGYDSKDSAECIANIANFANKPDNGDYLEDTMAYLNSGRGDIIALIDVSEEYPDGSQKPTTQAECVKLINQNVNNNFRELANKFSAFFAPRVDYDIKYNTDEYTNTIFPASFHYLVCAANAFENYNEWYAVSGYNRGITGNNRFIVKGLTMPFGDYAANVLQPRVITKVDADDASSFTKFSVNTVVRIRGQYYLVGNRTACALQSIDDPNPGLVASHFLNIRQLCATIKKQVNQTCDKLAYEPNSDILWVNFVNAIRPTLDKMKSDQGIKDYKFIKVKNTKKAVLTAKIRIVPIEAVEDFDISMYLEDSISGLSVEVEE